MNWTIRRTLIVSVAMLFVTAISVAEASAGWRMRGARCRGARVYRHTCCTNDGYRDQGYYAGHDHSNGTGYSGAAYSPGGYGGGYTTNRGYAQNNCGCNQMNSGSTGIHNSNVHGSSQLMTNGQTWSSGQANPPVTTGEHRINPNVVDQIQTQPYSAPTDNLRPDHGDANLPIDKSK